VIFWPITLRGHAREVSGFRTKCYRSDCVTHTGTTYGVYPICQRHAYEESIAERYSTRQAVAR
jgi:hypothetical protein